MDHSKQIESFAATHNIRYIHKSSNPDQEEDHDVRHTEQEALLVESAHL